MVDSLTLRLEDPTDREAWELARLPGFFDSFIRHVLDVVDSDPARGLLKLDTGLRIVSAPCDIVKVIGFRAAALRSLGSPDKSLRFLGVAAEIAGSCWSCQAYLLRHRAKTCATLGMTSDAFSAAKDSIDLYKSLQGLPDHDLHGNGLAHAFYTRGDVRQFIGIPAKDQALISGAIEDFSTALALIDPAASPKLFRNTLAALAVPLAATGKLEDLEKAEDYLRQARTLFCGPQKPSQERAKLAWITAMVRHELRVLPGRWYRPYRTLNTLKGVLSDFVKLAMPQETAAVASDIARIAFPERTPIRNVLSEAAQRLAARFELPDVAHRADELVPLRAAMDNVQKAANLRGLHAPDMLKAAIEELREACGPRMIACLVTWKNA